MKIYNTMMYFSSKKIYNTMKYFSRKSERVIFLGLPCSRPEKIKLSDTLNTLYKKPNA